MPRPTTAVAVTHQVRDAYLNPNLPMLVGWSIAASCRDPTCLAREPLSVGELLTKLGDRPLKAITQKLRCKICQTPAERVCLRQPATGGGYIEHVVVAPVPLERNY
jgi:hypothetical protein